MSDNTMTTETIEEKFQSYLKQIVPADRHAMELAKKRWDSVAKPIGSLGILEDDIIRIAGIRRSASGITLDKSALAVMCADHGVVAEGVTQTGKEVTRIVAENFTRGETSTSKMCRIAGTDLYPVDMGMDCEVIGVKQPDPHRSWSPKGCERFRKYRERTCDEQRGLPAGACFRDRTCVYVPGYGI